MNNKKLYIGIDTSNYTTSLGIVSENGELIANLKMPLPVKAGERGLRQSDAVFHHTVNLPKLLEQSRVFIKDSTILAIGFSERPRSVEGSYMPCFLVGKAAAYAQSVSSGAPFYGFSHQGGHIMAALFSSGGYDLLDKEFGAFHVSGGTTELLSVGFKDGDFLATKVGGTSDLNAGQVIDRIGVSLGLSFPAGRELEELALQNDKKIPKKKISQKDGFVSLSGLENLAASLYRQTEDKPLVCAFVLDYIGRALLALAGDYRQRYGDKPLVFAGGVMSNSIIKKMLSELPEVYFAEPSLSADNAVGTANLARLKYESEIKNGH